MTIDEMYSIFCEKRSDIFKHLPDLKRYSSMSEHVTEFGIRKGNSTIALLAGRPKRLVSYDIRPKIKYEMLRELAKPTEFILKIENTLKTVIEPTDFLFIDTYHTYTQIKKELELHGNVPRKFLAFHDTRTYGSRGEDKKRPGIMAGINEFIDSNPHWKIDLVKKNNNGFIVLVRG